MRPDINIGWELDCEKRKGDLLRSQNSLFILPENLIQ